MDHKCFLKHFAICDILIILCKLSFTTMNILLCSVAPPIGMGVRMCHTTEIYAFGTFLQNSLQLITVCTENKKCGMG